MYRLRDEVALALEDLNSAVQLCNGRGKVGEQAYCQRGLIHRLQGSEEEARGDFTAAARLGSKYAKKQVLIYTVHIYYIPSASFHTLISNSKCLQVFIWIFW